MKILILTPLYPPAVGGAASHYGLIAPKLAERNEIETLTILTEKLPGQPQRMKLGKLQILRFLPTRVSINRRPWLIHAFTYLQTQLWFATKFQKFVMDQKFNLIQFHTRYTGIFFYGTLNKVKIPVIADLRDKLTHPEKLLLSCNLLMCCSEGVQSFAVREGFPKERTLLIPITFNHPVNSNKVEIQKFLKNFGLINKSFVLFVGDINTNKGVYDLLDGFELWKTRPEGIKLVFVGINREGKHFIKRISQIKHTVYIDHLPHEEVLKLISASEILILPSRSEGLPRVILEALALNIKVICPPDIPEFEKYLPETVLPEISPGAIAKMLDKIYQSTFIPKYPLENHLLSRIINEMVGEYQKILET